jgi:predicted ATPase/class 3 adenylate cyclase/Flp pilus assembly protein TadD
VTFLFSDIEGSARRWERNPEAMSAALARHDLLLRVAIEAHGGYVFKVVGDAFCAAFTTAPAAVAAAVGGQRAILSEDFSAVDGIRVRMALHAGHAEQRDDDYFGPTLNRVARLMAIAHGGQVLISTTVADLLQDAALDGAQLRDLGAHRLKDLSRPEHVYQLAAAGLIEDFPPPRSLESFPNNLPQQLTSFVGRAETIAQIKTLLNDNRLVMLAGTGGAGKTRCAIQCGAEALDRFADGVWMVDLAPISDPVLVTTTIAKVLGVREAPDQDLLATLRNYLERRELLLILDNCEHLLDETRRVAAALLRGCAGVRLLATSREPLSIAGEQVLRLPSLQVPPPDVATTAETGRAHGAGELFVDRARSADERFELTDDNAPYVAEICRNLDGIPLAIELAAARVKLLSPRQLAERLTERFRVLTGGDRSALPRHQTLRATIDWSFELLDEPGRALFRRLSIFAGGWTLEAAAAVCAANSDDWEVLESLGSLVDKSLVVVEASAENDRRYFMLVSIREYAAARLAGAGDAEAIARAHAQFYAEFVRALAPLTLELEDREWKRRFSAELDNVRAAIDSTIVQKHDPPVGLALLADIEWPELIAMPHEALRWFESGLQLEDSMPSALVHARILRHCLILKWLMGHPIAEREAYALRAVEIARRTEDPNETALAFGNLGAICASAARFDEAERAFEQAYATPEQLSRIATKSVLRMWAVSNLQRGDVEVARRRFAEVVRLERPGSESHGSALLNLGELEYATGNLEAARSAARQALETYTRLNSVYTVLLLSNLAAYAIAAGDLDEARAHLREALRRQPDSGSGWVATIIETHALLAALLGDYERAALLAGSSEALFRARGDARQHTERRGHERLMQELAKSYTAAEISQRMEQGERLTEKEALAHAEAIHQTTISSAAMPQEGTA